MVFGLHFDGYARFGFPYCAQLANAAAQRFRETAELPETLTDLRVCLFFEQRRAHHAGRPDELGEAFVRALVRAIREKVARGVTD